MNPTGEIRLTLIQTISAQERLASGSYTLDDHACQAVYGKKPKTDARANSRNGPG
jgi:hypothetical protein